MLPNGISEIFLHGKNLIKYQVENQHLIDDNIRKLAADLNVEPIEIFGHVWNIKSNGKKSARDNSQNLRIKSKHFPV